MTLTLDCNSWFLTFHHYSVLNWRVASWRHQHLRCSLVVQKYLTDGPRNSSLYWLIRFKIYVFWFGTLGWLYSGRTRGVALRTRPWVSPTGGAGGQVFSDEPETFPVVAWTSSSQSSLSGAESTFFTGSSIGAWVLGRSPSSRWQTQTPVEPLLWRNFFFFSRPLSSTTTAAAVLPRRSSRPITEPTKNLTGSPYWAPPLTHRIIFTRPFWPVAPLFFSLSLI